MRSAGVAGLISWRSAGGFSVRRLWVAGRMAIVPLLIIGALLLAPSTRAASIPRLGQLRSLPQPDHWAMGIFDPLGQDLLITKKYYGLSHADTWLDVFVRDGAGTWFVDAQHMTQWTCPDTLLLVITGPGCELGPQMSPGGFNSGLVSQPLGIAMVPNPLWRAWTGHDTQTVLPDDHVEWTIPASFQTQHLIYGPQQFAWTSNDGTIDLTGTLVSPGSWYYLPTQTQAGGDTSNMYYDNAYYKVSGMYSGKHVTGYTIIENLWDNVSYDDTWWVKHRAGNWTAWTTTYANGTTQYGQFFCGPYGARGAVISDNKGRDVLQTNSINAYTEQADATGTPQKIRFALSNGQQWQYIGDPSATILPQDALGTSLSLGIVEPVGSTEKVISASAVQLTAGKMCAPEPLSTTSR